MIIGQIAFFFSIIIARSNIIAEIVFFSLVIIALIYLFMLQSYSLIDERFYFLFGIRASI